eukprot:94934_1
MASQIKVLASNECSNIEKRGWSPYADNGGTVAAIAGEGYCILASDTRLNHGYSILSRTNSKVRKINSCTVVAAGGMQADRRALFKYLDARHVHYEQQHFKPMSSRAIAQMVSNTLYGRRFFPYYTFNVVAGIDENGNGALFGYDAVGSMETVPYGAQGSGSVLATPLLDNQVGFLTHPQNKRKLNVDEAIELLKNVMTSVAERDINTGDQVELWIVTKAGVRKEMFQLRED